MNLGNGKFRDEALLRGAALDENGKALSGMGATAADYLHEGSQSIFRTNFSDELATLYKNRGKGEFDDVSTNQAWAATRDMSAGDAGSSTMTTTAGRTCFRSMATLSRKSTD